MYIVVCKSFVQYGADEMQKYDSLWSTCKIFYGYFWKSFKSLQLFNWDATVWSDLMTL